MCTVYVHVCVCVPLEFSKRRQQHPWGECFKRITTTRPWGQWTLRRRPRPRCGRLSESYAQAAVAVVRALRCVCVRPPPPSPQPPLPLLQVLHRAHRHWMSLRESRSFRHQTNKNNSINPRHLFRRLYRLFSGFEQIKFWTLDSRSPLCVCSDWHLADAERMSIASGKTMWRDLDQISKQLLHFDWITWMSGQTIFQQRSWK